jgi:hypothetical protein
MDFTVGIGSGRCRKEEFGGLRSAERVGLPIRLRPRLRVKLGRERVVHRAVNRMHL